MAGLSVTYLRELASDRDIDMDRVGKLLANMKALSNPVKPAALGIIGEDHLKGGWALRYADVTETSFRYKKKLGEGNGLPHVLSKSVLVSARKRKAGGSCVPA